MPEHIAAGAAPPPVGVQRRGGPSDNSPQVPAIPITDADHAARAEDQRAARADAMAREYFRVRYPLAERPVFHGPGVVGTVVDISETGMTLAAPVGARAHFRVDDRLTGVIHFKRAEDAYVDGVVIRLTPRGLVVFFDAKGIPWHSIQDEERGILATHLR